MKAILSDKREQILSKKKLNLIKRNSRTFHFEHILKFWLLTQKLIFHKAMLNLIPLFTSVYGMKIEYKMPWTLIDIRQ